MRRNMRKKSNQDDELNMKIIKYSGIGIAILAVIVFGLLIYSKSLNDEVKEGTLTGGQVANILNNTKSSENTESASTEIGKSVNEAETELKENNTVSNNTTNIVNSISTNSNTNVLTTNKVTVNNTTSQTNSKVEETEENKKEEKNVALSFVKPVDGEIVRDFAVDSLIYSETLQEWTTHTGIDIKAEKTTVVKAAETGTVKHIKNDPRYGLTIIIEHANGFQTVYSNLLTSEFVVEGEKVEKGQSLGTVGNTAAFEIADEPHLHFEILKDSVQLNEIHPDLKTTPLRKYANFLYEKIFKHIRYSKSSTDFLGLFYGEFMSYSGRDGQTLGIILTPKHICDLFCDLMDLKKTDKVFDPCCGSGGFLVSAMHNMLAKANNDTEKRNIRQNQLYGIEIKNHPRKHVEV